MQIQSRDSGNAVFMRATAGNGSFDYRGATTNTGNAVVTATSAASNYVPETYTLAFIQASATDPVTYTVTGDVSGQVAAGAYSEGVRSPLLMAKFGLRVRPPMGMHIPLPLVRARTCSRRSRI